MAILTPRRFRQLSPKICNCIFQMYFKFNLKMVDTIWFQFDLIRFGKDFSVWAQPRTLVYTWLSGSCCPPTLSISGERSFHFSAPIASHDVWLYIYIYISLCASKCVCIKFSNNYSKIHKKTIQIYLRLPKKICMFLEYLYVNLYSFYVFC